MGKSRKKWEREKKKELLRFESAEQNRLKSHIQWLVSKGKTAEAGLLIQKYKSKYE